MVGAVLSKTTNYAFNRIRFDMPGWHGLEHDNWTLVDALLASIGSVPGSRGIWQNGIAYVAGDRVADSEGGGLFRCAVAHTSAASGLFEDERTAHPTYWKLITQVPVWAGNWATATSYNTQDIVRSGNAYYFCINAHVSGVFATDLAAGNWTLTFDLQDAYNQAAAAAASASAAATSASNAGASATAASGSASSAASSASNASTSAGTASSAASAASASASAASGSASSASSSASSASGSASSASTSASNAASSASAAAASAATINPSSYALRSGTQFTGPVEWYNASATIDARRARMRITNDSFWRHEMLDDSGSIISDALNLNLNTGRYTFAARPVFAGVTPYDESNLGTTPAQIRSTISAPALPTTSAGAGQFTTLNSAVGGAAVLPAGGTWAYAAWAFQSGSGTITSATVAGVAAGGSTVGAAVGGNAWSGFCWRIA